jgi:hypothetical protein
VVEQSDSGIEAFIPVQPGPLQVGRHTVVFTNRHESYSGTGARGREWLTYRTASGWRLEFRDPGDVEATYAGTHASVSEAQAEARR